ncbi:hypothetical protein [Natronoglycomyces albus]|uniref:Uncharacterized protein n=1 Tax=Natronoglycomyces albus TaxID=2811108 RepID=A0A895XHK1_9ACTN|nr:hypothetical protein [Natronoglycomyces albus]QSB04407.1 hypothetical protein JQS30_11455 [Natronoglycomyces albus]
MDNSDQTESTTLARFVARAEQYSPVAIFLMVAGGAAVILLIPGILGGILTLALAALAASVAWLGRAKQTAPGMALMRILAIAMLTGLGIYKFFG